MSFGTQMFFTEDEEEKKTKQKNVSEGIVRLCDYMLIHHFEDECAAELITAEPIGDRRGGGNKMSASFMAL